MSLTATEYEARAVRGVRQIREATSGEPVAISDLLRDHTIAELVAEYEKAMALTTD